MSTRGCVAVGVPLKWEGLYNHCDSYPAGLGVDLWDILRHQRDLKDFCSRLLRHDSWAGFLAGELGTGYDASLNANHITSENPDPLFIEWVYIIDPERGMLHVMRNHGVGKDDWSKPRIDPPALLPGRIVDYGRFQYKHVLVASLKLGGPDPDWAALSRRGDEED